MQFIKHGKTKDVYRLDDGNILLNFKDTVTGHANTGESDPGGNDVVGEVAGVGTNALKVTTYYFQMLQKLGIKSHYVSADIPKKQLVVKPATPFGAGLEFVVRYIATGSFLRRFGAYCNDGDVLDPPVFEVTLKDDARNDPPATAQILQSLNLLTAEQYQQAHEQTLQICKIVHDDLASKGIKLYDIKIEFGLVDGEVTLIDEISAGNMRAYKNGKKLDYTQLSELICK